MKMQFSKSKIAIAGLFVFVTLAFILMRTAGRPMLYEIPGGFKGWIAIRFNDPTCPPLQRRGIWSVVEISPSGRACTSTKHDNRWVYYRFEYIYPGGNRKELALRSGNDPAGEIQVRLVTFLSEYQWEELFVGTKEDAGANWGKPPDPWNNPEHK